MKQVSGNDNGSRGERRHGVEVLAQHGGDLAHKNIAKHPTAYTRQHSK
jgi:hypothetical protein